MFKTNFVKWLIILPLLSLPACTSNVAEPNIPAAPTLGRLHVAKITSGDQIQYVIEDSQNRQVLLKGVALSGFEDQNYLGARGTSSHYPINPSAYNGKCPVNDGLAPDPPVCEVNANLPWYDQSTGQNSQNDLAQVRSAGFNTVRLTINWSELEPAPGQYSQLFIKRISQVVSWAGSQGISVILDLHEDQYSRFLNWPQDKPDNYKVCGNATGQDGAPQWATFTNGQNDCPLFGQNQLNPALAAALGNFWNNFEPNLPKGEAPGKGLEDHYIGAVAALARAFNNNPYVIGIELMNEPLAPGSGTIPVENLFTFSDNQLYPFYKRVIEAITGVTDNLATCSKLDPSGGLNSNEYSATNQFTIFKNCSYPDLGIHFNKLIFIEPTGWRNQVDFAPQLSYDSINANNLPGIFSEYPNLVYSPHIYTHVFTLDTLIGINRNTSVSPYQSDVSQSEIFGNQNQYPPSYLFGYLTARSEANALRAALVVTEFGDSPDSDSTILAGQTRAQQDTFSSSVFWTWKENCGTDPKKECSSGWGIYSPPNPGAVLSQNGSLRADRLKYLGGPYPLGINGRVINMAYDPDTMNYVLRISGATSEAPSQIELPGYDHAKNIVVTGAATRGRIMVLPDGTRLINVNPKSSNPYMIEIFDDLSKETLLINRLSNEDQTELAPIKEPVARQSLENYLSSLSQMPQYKSQASLLSDLINTFLGPPKADPNQ